MLPENATYGAWPLSGEIDLVEARGNGPTYPRQGNNFVRATLNYGPVPGLVEQIFGWCVLIYFPLLQSNLTLSQVLPEALQFRQLIPHIHA